MKEQRALLQEAHAHKGSSFVEIFQNCNIFNDGAFGDITDRKTRAERVIFVKHGEPLTFGTADAEKGLVLTPRLTLEVVDVTDENRSSVLVHDETNPVLAMLLARLRPPFPVAMGVLLRLDRACYEDGVHAQLAQASEADDAGDLSKVLAGRNTWTVSRWALRSRAPSRNCWNRAASTASCATSTAPSPARVASCPQRWSRCSRRRRGIVRHGSSGGWVDHIARMWPVDGVVGENGGLWYWMGDGKLERRFLQSQSERTANRVRLEARRFSKQFLARHWRATSPTANSTSRWTSAKTCPRSVRMQSTPSWSVSNALVPPARCRAST